MYGFIFYYINQKIFCLSVKVSLTTEPIVFSILQNVILVLEVFFFCPLNAPLKKAHKNDEATKRQKQIKITYLYY